MKRCPTCQKTFDDSMRFCQTDGTQLVEDKTPVDPYKTMVASADDIASALSSPSGSEPPQSSSASVVEEEPLEIPAEPAQSSTGPSGFETGIADSRERDEGQVMEIPPLAESMPPGPPKFSEPSVSLPSFGEATPPPSPFASSQAPSSGGPGDFPTTPPIPSPFGDSSAASFEPPPSEPQYSEPEPASSTPQYDEPGPISSTPQYAEPGRPEPSPAFDPFEAQAAAPSETRMAQSEWTPPPAGQNQPFQSPPSSAPAGQNKTLSIVSLICGIAGLTICCGSFVVSLIAIILGFMARSKANQNPGQYGGSGLALGGIITGALGLVGGLIVWIVYIFYFAAIMSQMK